MLLGVGLAGCSLDSMKLPPLTASLGAETPVTSSTTTSPDAPVEVYARIARGALKCWFGAEGSLKATHQFHARVDPPSQGGSAEVVVHTRDQAQPTQGALRAYRIAISPSSSGSQIEAQNLKFPEAQGATMTADVGRWIQSQDGCTVVGTGGWDAKPPGEVATAKADPAAGKKAKGAKVKAAAKAKGQPAPAVAPEAGRTAAAATKGN